MTALPTVVPIDAGYTVPAVLVRQTERLGGKTFVGFDPSGVRLSYEGLVALAEAGSTRLGGELGLPPGTMAAIFLPNGPDFIVAAFSCLFAGCVDVPVNHEYRKATLAFALEVSDAAIVYTDAEGWDRLADPELAAVTGRLRYVVLCGDARIDERPPLVAASRRGGAVGSGGGGPSGSASSAAGPRAITLAELTSPIPSAGLWRRVQAEALASIRFTSGTTGKAKGIMHSHLHMLGKAMAINRVLDAAESDVLYSPFPLHHNLSSINGLMGMLQAGGTMVSAPRFSASGYWPAVRRWDATLAHILNPMMPMLLAQPPSPDDRAHRVRYLWTAPGSRAFVERFGAQPVMAYALSEVGVIAYRRDGGEEGSRANGPLLPEFEVAIVDALDRPLPQGESGQIVIRPRHPHRMTLGYYNDLPATLTAFRNLWYHTGDAGHFGPDGQLHFTGRLGDTVRRRGVSISSEQVDAEIVRHPAVEACAVVGVPAEVGDEELHALVVLHDRGADADAFVADLLRFLAARLPRDYVPRYVEVVAALPLTTTGKVRKNDARGQVGRAPVWDRDTGRWRAPGTVEAR